MIGKIDQMEDCNKLSISVISNIIFDPYFPRVMREKFSSGIKIHPIPFDERTEQGYTEQLSVADIIIVWLNCEEMFRNPTLENDAVNVCHRLMDDLSAYKALKLWFLFEDYYDKLNVCVGNVPFSTIDSVNLKITHDDFVLVDLKWLIANVGVANAYDNKGKYRWNAPYSKSLIQAVVDEIHKQYLIDRGTTKKCLVLDCDNVLWGGILSEDSIENIKLGGSGFGRPYQDFQRFALSLYYHGVILAICSKNDLSDVMTMFREHSEMILKEEHIACFQVNWDNKIDNIKRIAETLNIGLDSMVFVDDSRIEVEAVKSMLPEVTAILYDRDSIYDKLSCFNLKSNISITDIEKRNETYRTNQSREALKSKYQSYDEYINALEIKMDIHEALPIEYSRIAELTQRTNKCTNGKRYAVAEIKDSVIHENVKLYSISVSDRFSDLGLVGAFEVEGNTLTLFSLSCRALGREIESKLLEFIVSKYQIHNIEIKSTGKNEDVKAVFAKVFPHAAITDSENV